MLLSHKTESIITINNNNHNYNNNWSNGDNAIERKIVFPPDEATKSAGVVESTATKFTTTMGVVSKKKRVDGTRETN